MGMDMDAAALVLPLATGIALSPFPAIGIVLVLSGPRAASAGPAFAAGFVAGLSTITLGAILLMDGSGPRQGLLASLLRLGVGMALLALAFRKWRRQSKSGTETSLPGWMAALDGADPLRALGLGIALGGLNPKNLGLTAAAAASIAATGLTGRETLWPATVFVLIGSCVVLGTTLYRLVAGHRALGPLEAARGFLTANGAVMTAMVFILIGAKLVGEGLAGLAS